MNTLHWRKTKDGWQAWASRILPGDKFPPKYVLTITAPRSPQRKVELTRYGYLLPDTVGIAENLAAAKELAEKDYIKRQNDEKQPPKPS